LLLLVGAVAVVGAACLHHPAVTDMLVPVVVAVA